MAEVQEFCEEERSKASPECCAGLIHSCSSFPEVVAARFGSVFLTLYYVFLHFKYISNVTCIIMQTGIFNNLKSFTVKRLIFSFMISSMQMTTSS